MYVLMSDGKRSSGKHFVSDTLVESAGAHDLTQLNHTVQSKT